MCTRPRWVVGRPVRLKPTLAGRRASEALGRSRRCTDFKWRVRDAYGCLPNCAHNLYSLAACGSISQADQIECVQSLQCTTAPAEVSQWAARLTVDYLNNSARNMDEDKNKNMDEDKETEKNYRFTTLGFWFSWTLSL